MLSKVRNDSSQLKIPEFLLNRPLSLANYAYNLPKIVFPVWASEEQNKKLFSCSWE